MTTAKKKILFLITKSNFGGAQRYVYELATNLPKDQYEVVVAFGGKGILAEKLEEAGIRTVTIQSFQRDIDITKELKSFLELWHLYKKEQPDVVHLNSSKAGGSGALIARLAGVKRIIYTAHGWAFWEPRPNWWKTLVWGVSWLTTLLCHQIILVSKFEQRQTHFPFTRDKFSVIYTSVPKITFLDADQARSSLFTFGDVSRHQTDLWLITNAELNNNKNLFAAIDAVVEYNQKHPKKIFYNIVSDGELKTQLTEYIAEKDATEQVKLHGYVDNIRVYLKAFDVFLLPSKKEGMPYAILEAGAAGLPVIASNVGGIPEVIKGGYNGYLIDPHDSQTIIDALDRLTEDEEQRTVFGQRLQERVAESFDLAAMVDKTAKLY